MSQTVQVIVVSVFGLAQAFSLFILKDLRERIMRLESGAMR